MLNKNQKEKMNVSKDGKEIQIRDISNENTHVDMICKILTINSKEYMKNGNKSKRYYGLLEDSSGTISFSAWRDLGITKNDMVQIEKAEVKQWQGVLQINIDRSTKVTKISDENLIKKFRLKTNSVPNRKLSIKSFKPGLSDISCVCRVISVEPLEVKIKDDVKTVYKGLFADKSGSVRFTAWEDFKLQSNTVIDVQDATAKVWRGFLELNLNRQTKVTALSSNSLPPKSKLPIDQNLSIEALFENEYLQTPEFTIEGTIIELKEGSGLIFRCSKCSRAIQGSECLIHGKVEVNNDLRLKAVIDDGTGAINVFFGRELTEKLIGRNLEECMEMMAKCDDSNRANELLINHLLINDVRVKGGIIHDDFGVTIFANSVTFVDTNSDFIHSEAEVLLESLG